MEANIESFVYTYMREDNKGYEEISVKKNIITQQMIDNTIKYKVKKVLIDNVMVNDRGKTVNYGYHIIYIK
jgi:hypothetical protein